MNNQLHIPADVFDSNTWSKELEGASGVVSCIGAFGSEAFMEKINGDANIHAVETAAKAGKQQLRFWKKMLIDDDLSSPLHNDDR